MVLQMFVWLSSGLEALLCKPKGSVVATNAPPRWHRHFYKEAGVLKTPAFFLYTSVKKLLSLRWCPLRTPRGVTFSDATRD